jgi:ribosomal silencing factor RsfS
MIRLTSWRRLIYSELLDIIQRQHRPIIRIWSDSTIVATTYSTGGKRRMCMATTTRWNTSVRSTKLPSVSTTGNLYALNWRYKSWTTSTTNTVTSCRSTSTTGGNRPPTGKKQQQEMQQTTLAVAGTQQHSNNDDDDIWSEWIRPNRPLAGDQGQPANNKNKSNNNDDDDDELLRIAEQLRQLEQAEARQEQNSAEPLGVVDWLKTRRQKALREEQQPTTSNNDTTTDVAIKLHTLLSKDEIATCVQGLGGRDISIILDDPSNRRMGGAVGIIVVTARSATQLRVMATALVRHLRLRHLQDFNVLGAQLGPEGNSDNKDEGWLVVDCRNYIVHLQDEATRDAVNLQAIWSGTDGLHRLNMADENAVDDYIARNPVPETYGSRKSADPFAQLQKSRWTAPHQRPPVIVSKRARGGKQQRSRSSR